jgi:nitrilase
LAGPLSSGEDVLYAEIDLSEIPGLMMSLDIAGHYDRPDVFTLTVNRTKQSSLQFHE